MRCPSGGTKSDENGEVRETPKAAYVPGLDTSRALFAMRARVELALARGLLSLVLVRVRLTWCLSGD